MFEYCNNFILSHFSFLAHDEKSLLYRLYSNTPLIIPPTICLKANEYYNATRVKFRIVYVQWNP